MPDALTRPSDQLFFRRFPLVAMIAAGIAGLLVAATVALWVHFGSAVFYEMLLAGFAACF